MAEQGDEHVPGTKPAARPQFAGGIVPVRASRRLFRDAELEARHADSLYITARKLRAEQRRSGFLEAQLEVR